MTENTAEIDFGCARPRYPPGPLSEPTALHGAPDGFQKVVPRREERKEGNGETMRREEWRDPTSQ